MSHPDFIGVSFSNITQERKLPGQARHDKQVFLLHLTAFSPLWFICNLLIRVNVAEECDARDDDSSTAACIQNNKPRLSEV